MANVVSLTRTIRFLLQACAVKTVMFRSLAACQTSYAVYSQGRLTTYGCASLIKARFKPIFDGTSVFL